MPKTDFMTEQKAYPIWFWRRDERFPVCPYKCPSIVYKSYYWLKLSCEVIHRFLLESSLRRDLRARSIITGAKTRKTEKKRKEKD